MRVMGLIFDGSWWRWVLRRERVDGRVASFILVGFFLDSV
jgi:hypothetical protein